MLDIIMGKPTNQTKLSKSNTIFLSFETLLPPQNATHFVQCWKKQPAQVLQDVKLILSSSSAASTTNQRMDSRATIVDHL
jgi:Elongator subunit Iki1